VLVNRLDLERDFVVSSRFQHAQHCKLEIVHPLVREIEPTSDAAENERRDSRVAGPSRNCERDLVAHLQLRAHSVPSPTLAPVVRPGDLEVTVEPSSDGVATVVRIEGDLDVATCSELEAALESADVRKRVVVDLSRCTFLDSSAVRALVHAARSAGTAGGTVALVTQDPGILRVLAIARVDSMLPVHETVESAL
jgi:anti-anti-sigma factor